MTTSKSKKDLPKQMEEITERILKFWFIDEESMKVKHVDDYPGSLVGFDTEKESVINNKGFYVKVYVTQKEATIAMYKMMISQKKELWQYHIDASYKINNEISEVIKKLHTLSDTQDEREYE